MRPLKFKDNRVYVNRPKLNEGAAARLNMHIANGWYAHESTDGDIEVYVLTEACPFRKRDVTKEELGISQMCRELVELAKRREFDAFVDGVNELAFTYKGHGMESADFLDAMRRVESIASRESGSPLLPYELRKHLEMARQKRAGTIIAT